MHFHLLTTILFGLLATFAGAVADQTAVIVSYPDDTPHSVIEKAMKAIEAAGGAITHEYHLIKGFAAMASVEALNTVKSMGEEFPVLVEQDQGINVSNA